MKCLVWPGLANFFLLPRLLTLGRAARFVERTIFIGGMAGFVAARGVLRASASVMARRSSCQTAVVQRATVNRQPVPGWLQLLNGEDAGGIGRNRGSLRAGKGWIDISH